MIHYYSNTCPFSALAARPKGIMLDDNSTYVRVTEIMWACSDDQFAIVILKGIIQCTPFCCCFHPLAGFHGSSVSYVSQYGNHCYIGLQPNNANPCLPDLALNPLEHNGTLYYIVLYIVPSDIYEIVLYAWTALNKYYFIIISIVKTFMFSW